MSGNPNDFVIRDGFPALRSPRRKGSSGGQCRTTPPEPQADVVAKDDDSTLRSPCWILEEADEPLPRFDVWAADGCFEFPAAVDSSSLLERLWDDCRTVFSARTREDASAYSNGTTYFLPSQMKPRCALEAMVQTIFQAHTSCLLMKGEVDGMMIPEQSGAEWWTLVLETKKDKPMPTTNEEDDGDDDGDEVGMHFDADYGLEDQAPNLLLHPRVATVTYLTDPEGAAPTVILDQRSPPPNDVEKKTLQGPISKAWISHPKLGKHLAFDGRLLHGAPATFFPAMSTSASQEPPSKRVKPACTQRITLLVNIWVNHCPLDAEPLEDEICQALMPIPKASQDGGKDDSVWFSWTKPDLDKPSSTKNVFVKPSAEDPAGEEEVVICNRLVTVKYNPRMEVLHEAARAGEMVLLEFEDCAAALEVGDEVQEEEEE